MGCTRHVRFLGCMLLVAAGMAHGQDAGPSRPDGQMVPSHDVPATAKWLDRTHLWLFDSVWRSARAIDGWFGPPEYPATKYQQATGSVAPALLWDQYDGFQPRFRFNVDLPLPRLNEKFHAFIGRVNRDEYVTEREIASGAFPSQINRVEDDQTLFGIRYRSPEKGAHFQADAGVRLQFPLDPFVKGSYVFEHGESSRALFLLRETGFWQNSEGFGVTSRFDVERVIDLRWLVRGSISGTISQESEGVRGYTALTVMRGFPNRRAVAAQIFSRGEMDAEVPLEDYGVKLAYRRSVSRDWLILELRTSLTWPKEMPAQHRTTNFGVGIGFEAFFGTDEFLARPVTF
ncbi:MAG TPA: hypothetical protein VFS13_00800 [Steroidobacteraceae bacterium]|nr:hypothetical protein [Steroidobacteraceae bacterium]